MFSVSMSQVPLSVWMWMPSLARLPMGPSSMHHDLDRRVSAQSSLHRPMAETLPRCAEAGANADVMTAARKLHAAALDLQGADRITKRDAHISFRAAEASYRAAFASAKAVGDAAVAVAQQLVEASNAFDVAAKAVVDAVDSDAKLAARRDLEAAEEAFKTLYEPLERARRPRPTSRAVRRRPTTLFASQAKKLAEKAAQRARRPRPTTAPFAVV